jgi:hypothetical protein
VVAFIGGYNLLVNLNPAFALLSIGYLAAAALGDQSLPRLQRAHDQLPQYPLLLRRLVLVGVRHLRHAAADDRLHDGAHPAGLLPACRPLCRQRAALRLRRRSAPSRRVGPYFANFGLSVLLAIGLFAVVGTLAWLGTTLLPEGRAGRPRRSSRRSPPSTSR